MASEEPKVIPKPGTFRVFYSQPFHGRTEKEIFEDRDKLMGFLEPRIPQKVIIIDQYHQKFSSEYPTLIIAKDIYLMGQADLVVFDHGWQDSSGCRIERLVARKYGLHWVTINKKFTRLTTGVL